MSENQHGFFTGRSITTQLLRYLDDCANIISRGGVFDEIYLDSGKAYSSQSLTSELLQGSALEAILIQEYININDLLDTKIYRKISTKEERKSSRMDQMMESYI